MTQKDFEQKFHYKVIKPNGLIFDIPIKEYVVTAALLNFEENETVSIFAIKATDYNLENKHAFTFRINKDELEAQISDFTILRDGFEEYAKPKIISETLVSFVGEEKDEWLCYFSDYYKDDNFIDGKPKTAYVRIPKNLERLKHVSIGYDEYFIKFQTFILPSPQSYTFPVPSGLLYKEDILEYVKPFRQDILDCNILNGIKLIRK